ncbi:ABC transporter permease [Wenjunlia tyrosinilytica]|uniref:Transport permease protein n=1 Tax=Wenjunlia tyrosinilytica TaxID=1544741 RepID=A0A917ZK30_9ACTN|nr:ABC transporter permease [Wenjunlia tyrosinilytica]GGO83267.1 transport permease protein [Wenjunlia tyrosinilytica]
MTTAPTTAAGTSRQACDAPEATSAQLAARYGLTPSSVRPTRSEYLRLLWQRRDFITAYAHARITSMYSGARLGQVWHILTPLLSVGVYYLVFGMLLKAKGGTGDNYIAFLSVGMFVFTYTRESVSMGTKSIADRLPLIRALHFPRASLPIAATIVQLEQLLFSLAVVFALVLGTGEPVTLRWLCLVPALALQTVFNLGLAMFMSRIGARLHDMGELVPFILRTWMYSCGVFYSVEHVTQHAPAVIRLMLEWNPGAVYIELARFALIDGYQQIPANTWFAAGIWAVVAVVGGFLFCWQAEDRYGRG